MARFWANYALAAHLSVMTVAPLFLYPWFSGREMAQTVVWLALWAAVWMLVGPSCRNDETLHNARVRVRRAIVRDPLFYLSLLAAAIAAVRWLNGGVARVYEIETGRWLLSAPAVAALPGCVTGRGLPEFAVTLAAGLLLVACRNALGKTARVATVAFVSLCSGWCGLVHVVLVGKGLIDSSACPELGAGFGVGLVLSAMTLAGVFFCRWNRYLLLYAIGLGGNALGLAVFAGALEAMAFAGAAALCAIVSVGWILLNSQRADALKYAVMIVAAAAVFAFVPMGVFPNGELEDRMREFSGPEPVPAGFFAARAYHAQIARNVWREHPWMGAGLGSYPIEFGLRASGEPRRECLRRLRDDSWRRLRPHQGTLPEDPLNGWWWILCERGIVGLACAGTLALAAVASLIGRAVRTHARRIFWPLPVAAAIAAVMAIGTMLLNRWFAAGPALLPLTAAAACAVGAFPPPRRDEGDDSMAGRPPIGPAQDGVE